MNSSRKFIWAVCGIFGFQLLVMLLTTPMYEIDTNSYIQGGFSWSIFHNPLLNMIYAVAGKIWPNAYFMVGIQLLVYAFCASFFVYTLFPAGRWRVAALVIAAAEPVSLFYHLSMISESLFTSFLLLMAAFMIRWLRNGRWQDALWFGCAFGFAFLSKLGAMPLVPMLGLILLRRGTPVLRRFAALGVALLPFVLCYQGVKTGQRIINHGGLYTVEGRVRWDFSSALYDPSKAPEGPFRELVHPWFVKNGKVEPDRELRRELSYLGYKQCVLSYGDNNAAILTCDSIFGEAAKPVMENRLAAAELQFARENLYSVHHLNYLDYRFTPGLPFYHPQREYDYLDSLMTVHYSINLGDRYHRIPVIWRSLGFTNVYMPVIWWMWWAVLLFSAVRWWRNRGRHELLAAGFMVAIPLVFHVVYISYRPRFLAPFLVLVLVLVLWNVMDVVKKEKGNRYL